MIYRILLLFYITILFGCATPLRDSPEQLRSMTSEQGIIYGSVIIRFREDNPTFPRSLENLDWYVKVTPIEGDALSSSDRSIRIKSNGEEVPIFALLPAGTYEISGFYEQGFKPNVKILTRILFEVSKSSRTYIGRVVLTIPREIGTLDSILFKRRPADITIEDALDKFIEYNSHQYTELKSNEIQKKLMKN